MATALSPFLHGDLVVVADMLAGLVDGALAPLAADLASCNRSVYTVQYTLTHCIVCRHSGQENHKMLHHFLYLFNQAVHTCDQLTYC